MEKKEEIKRKEEDEISTTTYDGCSSSPRPPK